MKNFTAMPQTLGTLALAALMALGSVCAMAQEGAIRMLVGFPAGGSTDAIARLLAAGMQQELGKTVVVDNRPGAGGQIAAQALKAARPDGLTLFLSNSHTVSMIPLTLTNPGFDTARDFAPVGLVAINPDVFAINPEVVGNPSAGLREFAQWAKANPGKGNVGVPAPASAPDFAVGVVAAALATDLKSVPYRGDGPVAQDLVGGQIAGGIGSVGAMLQHAKAGKIRIVAVNGSSRLQLLPEVPTLAESGMVGFQFDTWIGLFAPKGTPKAVIDRLNAETAAAVADPAIQSRLTGMSLEPRSSSPDELGIRTRDGYARVSRIIKEANIKAD